jgi:xylulokinase
VTYAETPRTETSAFHPDLCFVPPVRASGGLGCLSVFEFSQAARPLECALRSLLAMPDIPGDPLAEGNDEPSRVRSLLEHASFWAKRMFAAMDALGAPQGPIYATGGWSRSLALLKLRASVYDAPITVLGEQEPSVVGAALLAAEAAGANAQFHSTTSIVEPVSEWARAYAGASAGRGA